MLLRLLISMITVWEWLLDQRSLALVLELVVLGVELSTLLIMLVRGRLLENTVASMTAGATQAYAAEAFDQYDNSLGMVTGSTVFSISVGAGGSWSGAVYTSDNAGTWTVTGEYSGKYDCWCYSGLCC